MICVGILGQSMFYLQLLKILKNQSAEDVSLFGFICGFIAALSWSAYGFTIGDKPLLITSVIGSIGSFLVIAAILVHG
jgi:uncharacterized protein with PQ loop repeat